MPTLISASPSPYARKVRIALAEKTIPFTLQTEVPWDSTTKTPLYNPLEKLSVLLIDHENASTNGNTKLQSLLNPDAIYESHHILDYLETTYLTTPLLPSAPLARLLAKRAEVLADGICDALVLLFFEKQREHPSEAWTARQQRKVDGGLSALAEWVDTSAADGRNIFLLGDEGGFSLADVAVGCVLGYLAVRWPGHDWQEKHPRMKMYWEALEERESFKGSRPKAQNVKDQIV